MPWDFLVSYRGRGALGFPEVRVPWDFLVSYRGRGALGLPPMGGYCKPLYGARISGWGSATKIILCTLVGILNCEFSSLSLGRASRNTRVERRYVVSYKLW